MALNLNFNPGQNGFGSGGCGCHGGGMMPQGPVGGFGQMGGFPTPVVESTTGPVVGRAAQGHRLAVLVVLALAGGRPVRRDRLVALLWPESSADRARPPRS